MTYTQMIIFSARAASKPTTSSLYNKLQCLLFRTTYLIALKAANSLDICTRRDDSGEKNRREAKSAVR